jgi:flavorubredoxin
LSIFGSSTWNGAGVKALAKYAPEMGMEVAGSPLEIMGSATYDKLAQSAEQFVEEFLKSL